MPVYTYRCDNCGVQFERRQSFNERHLIRCPECGKNALHRVYKPIGVVFKGSGFYVTDNRSSSATLPARSGTQEGDSKTTDKPADTSPSKEKSSAPEPKETPAKD